MQTPNQIIENGYLDHRHALLEFAAFLDRIDAATARTGQPPTDSPKLEALGEAVRQLTEAGPEDGRTKRMLELFTTVTT
jgi:hypothetical protein